MSIIKNVQDYLTEYDGMSLVPIKEIDTEYTPSMGGTYALAPQGNSVVKRDVLGNVTYQNSYAFFARENVGDEVNRMDMYDFLENLTDWLEYKADKEEFPKLAGKYEVVDLQASNHMLVDIEENGLGVYQVQIILTIKKRKQEERNG